MHGGVPMPERVGIWTAPVHTEPSIKESDDYTARLKALLARPSIASKEWVVRQYDHEVQGNTVVKPLVGEANDGPGDAAVLWPIEMRNKGSYKGVILSNGICPRRSRIDTYWMTAGAVDEAVRNAVAVGAEVDSAKLFVLDNFCWSDPDNPQRIAELIRAARAWYEVTVAYRVPTISGKDSMSNHHDYTDASGVKRRDSIPPSLLVTGVGVMDDVRKTVTMDFKEGGNRDVQRSGYLL
jgi:phosphoribosylformylglycinamidine synthase